MIAGTVFAVTADEIREIAQHVHEVAAVKRVTVLLQSGTFAWAYVDARSPNL